MKPALIILLLTSFYSTVYNKNDSSDIPPSKPSWSSWFTFPKNRKLPTVSTRIIGGFEVKPPHVFPFQVALYINTFAFCGGTLIARDWVLTAAHCLDSNPRPRDIIASLGRHNIHNPEYESRQNIIVSNYFVHPEWDDLSYIHDIALLKLSRNASINEYVNTVSIATTKQGYKNSIGITIGWGITESNSMASVLRFFTNPVLSNDECRSIWPFHDVITAKHVCVSGQGNRGSCNGDSGGPLIVNTMQVGVVSFGYITCNESKPTVYTRLTEYNSWITHVMENSSNPRELYGINLIILFVVCILRIIWFV